MRKKTTAKSPQEGLVRSSLDKVESTRKLVRMTQRELDQLAIRIAHSKERLAKSTELLQIEPEKGQD